MRRLSRHGTLRRRSRWTLARLNAAFAGRYEVERELGAGGMATVYLTRDLRHDRYVALKVLNADMSHALGAERFLHEIRITARLEHPHILTLIDRARCHTGRDNTALLYYVMPYVEGESLRARISRERQLPLAEAVRLVAQAADALGYAHDTASSIGTSSPRTSCSLAITSRSPTSGSRARRRGQTGSAHRHRRRRGHTAYMSPEQILGEHDLDGRSRS